MRRARTSGRWSALTVQYEYSVLVCLVLGFLNKIACNGLWREICQFAFPLKDVPKPFLPTYPFSPSTHEFRIIVQGIVPGDEDLCNGWNQLTVIHLVPIPKE